MTFTKQLILTSAFVAGFVALTSSAYASGEQEAAQYIPQVPYKTGSATVVRTYPAEFFTEGAYLTENGYEVQVIENDPSQIVNNAQDIRDPNLFAQEGGA